MTGMTEETTPEHMGYGLEAYEQHELEAMDPRAVIALGYMSLQRLMIKGGNYQAAVELGDDLISSVQYEIDADAAAAHEAARIQYYVAAEDRARRDDSNVTDLGTKRSRKAGWLQSAVAEPVAA